VKKLLPGIYTKEEITNISKALPQYRILIDGESSEVYTEPLYFVYAEKLEEDMKYSLSRDEFEREIMIDCLRKLGE
jgi:hypothetical protein